MRKRGSRSNILGNRSAEAIASTAAICAAGEGEGRERTYERVYSYDASLDVTT